MKFSIRHLAIAGTLLLGGCSLTKVGPDYQAPALHLPNEWTASTSSETAPVTDQIRLARWWMQFDDEILNDLIDQPSPQLGQRTLVPAVVLIAIRAEADCRVGDGHA